MARNIVLLSDGTGNSAGKLLRTNVWRLYQALDLGSAAQVAYYDDGVGTSSIKPLAIIGGAFGWGLKRNILDLYTFLCRNYQDGDRIYGFGFSRGAFTIRVLMQLVLAKGLIKEFNSGDHLRRQALWLYRDFRRQKSTHFTLATIVRKVRDLVLRRPVMSETVTVPSIAFLGLWDTVDAYGVPIEELKRGIDRLIWPLNLGDKDLDPRIDKACHALAIDDTRKTFHPLLWDETNLDKHPHRPSTDEEKLTQVWFVGAHANVGGGYPDDGLSYVPLQWMIREARKHDLLFTAQAIRTVDDNAAPYGRLYDSRAGFASYYRYDPRLIDPPEDKQGAVIPHPKIHESVIWRMAVGTDAYAPLSLPQTLRVVVDPPPPDPQKASPPTDPQQPLPPSDAPKLPPPAEDNILLFDNYAAAVQAEGNLFFAPGGAATELDTRQKLATQFGALQKPDPITIDLIWNTIWWRRIAYFSVVGVSTLLVLYPALPDSEPLYSHERITGLQDLAIGPVTIISTVLGSFLPSLFSPWLDAFRSNPFTMSSMIAILVLFFVWGKALDRRVQDRALAAWNMRWGATRLEWLVFRIKWRKRLAVAMTVLALGGIAGSIYFAMQAGPSTLLVDGRPCEIEPCGRGFRETSIFANAPVVYDVNAPIRLIASQLAMAFAALAALGVIWRWSLTVLNKDVADCKRELPGLALQIASVLRTSPKLVPLYRLTGKIVPIGFALALLAAGAFLINYAAFAIESAWGVICKSEYPLMPLPSVGVTTTFEIKKGCHGSKYRLLANEKYTVEILSSERWNRNGLELASNELSPAGFSTPWRIAPQMLLLLPLRRMPTERWFVPVARVGATGNDEHVLDVRSTVITPRRDGEFFFYVNEAVIGLPGLWDTFYQHNGGRATVSIRRAQIPVIR
jgi:hypothetical protein